MVVFNLDETGNVWATVLYVLYMPSGPNVMVLSLPFWFRGGALGRT